MNLIYQRKKRSSVFSVSIDVLSNVTIGAKISRGDQPKKIVTRQEIHLLLLSAITNTIKKPLLSKSNLFLFVLSLNIKPETYTFKVVSSPHIFHP